jgi:DNA-binding NtrC family response regulator
MKIPKILVVDDERSVRQALRFELEEDGYEVVYASNYAEAMDAYSAFGADMIITDVFLESGNGVELMERINLDKKKIPFIVITAFPDSELGMHAKTMVRERFHEKPFYMDKLKTQISEILSNQVYSFAT